MNRPPIFLLVMLSFCTVNASAQQAEATASSTLTLPASPLLRPAPDFYQWTITFSYPDSEPKNNPGAAPAPATAPAKVLGDRTQTITTTKTGKIIHEEIVSMSGGKTDAWQIDGNYYIKYPGRTIWAAYEKADTSEAGGLLRETVMLPPSGFRGLTWITGGTYAGRTTAEYGDCLVFAPGGPSAVGGDLSAQKLATLPIIAYINPKTRLPLMDRELDGTRAFTFSPLSSNSLQTLPDALTAEIQAGNALRARNNAAPRKEY
jgi:hypothetical protein